MKISWIGTSISNPIDKEQVERNTNSNINITRAYSINEDKNAQLNVKDIVPKVVVKEKPDVLILQAGSTELNNIKVNEAMMDITKDIEEHKKEWFK